MNVLKCALSFFHRHQMERQAHWCDKECSVIIVEYKCATCDHEAFDFVYFDDSRCKVLKRVPTTVSADDAPKLVKCGEQTCDKQKTNPAPQRSGEYGRRITDHAPSGGKTAKEKRGTKKAKAK